MRNASGANEMYVGREEREERGSGGEGEANSVSQYGSAGEWNSMRVNLITACLFLDFVAQFTHSLTHCNWY